MDAQDLKKYINDNNHIEYILEKLNCHHIVEYEKEYRAGLPDRNYGNSIVVRKNDSLSIRIYTKEKTIEGDIFTLIMTLKNFKYFSMSNKWLHNILNLPYVFKIKNEEISKKDPLAVFKRLKVKPKKTDTKELKTFNENILRNIVLIPSLSFFKEGISIQTQHKFNIGYCIERERIGIPHRFWQNGEFLGIMGRTTISNFDDFNIAKYIPITNPFYKSLNLYGLAENYKQIQEKKEVIVVEGEKSVMKFDTWKWCNAVAVCKHEISPEQKKILIGLNVDIVIAYDKDVPEKHLKEECKMFKGIRNVSYIYDKHDLLDEKNSPCDKGIKVWNYLYKHRKYI